MDPLSIAASIFATEHAAGAVRTSLRKFGGMWEVMPVEVQGIYVESTKIVDVCDALAKGLQEETNVPNRDALELLHTKLDETTLALTRVSQILKARKREPIKQAKISRPLLGAARLSREDLKVLKALLYNHRAGLSYLATTILSNHINEGNIQPRKILSELEQELRSHSPIPDNLQSQTPRSSISLNSLDRIRIILPSATADQHPKDSNLVEKYMMKLGLRYRRYFDKLIFEQDTSYYIKMKPTAGLEPIEKPKLEELKPEIFDNVFSDLTKEASSNRGGNIGELLLIVCDVHSAVPNTVPFTRDKFVTIINNLGLSPGIFQALYAGTPKSMYYGRDGDSKREGFILRTPMSGTENWTLAISWDSECRTLNGFLHGLQTNEISSLVTYLGDSREELIHPMNLPVILCEMITESDSNGIKRRAKELYQVEIRTNYHGYPRNEAAEEGHAKSPEKDFEEMTRSLNIIISRLAFHEMRINANAVFTDQILERILAFETDAKNLEEGGEEEWHKKLQSASRPLLERLVHLKTEHQALLLEIACNQKIAQSQLEIVYNLVAQRDNKDNLKLAKVSTDIANTTKDDSRAMRTIAVMSIAFLPGTFVSSFFSMDMFNWQAAKDEAVLSSRFYIYWAVAVPLTLVVFIVWFLWLRSTNKHDKYTLNSENDIRGEANNFSTLISMSSQSPAWYRKARTRFRAKDEETQPIEESTPTNLPRPSSPTEPMINAHRGDGSFRSDLFQDTTDWGLESSTTNTVSRYTTSSKTV
ncbi:hypothetical protein FQN52_005518 [Onygenales sp. PD_12]|nr:hypothetical protein FQN52_005518 [Onygenales sp. PD_12]